MSFFDTLDHGWLVKFVEHRVADRRVVRLIQKWLKRRRAGGWEADRERDGHGPGREHQSALANVYLHYVFDLWVQRWRKKQAHGDVVVVRFADDCAPRRRGREVVTTDRKCLAAREMRVGPSDSDGRVRAQTTGSCCGTMAAVVSVSEKAGRNPSGECREDERE